MAGRGRIQSGCGGRASDRPADAFHQDEQSRANLRWAAVMLLAYQRTRTSAVRSERDTSALLGESRIAEFAEVLRVFHVFEDRRPGNSMRCRIRRRGDRSLLVILKLSPGASASVPKTSSSRLSVPAGDRVQRHLRIELVPAFSVKTRSSACAKPGSANISADTRPISTTSFPYSSPKLSWQACSGGVSPVPAAKHEQTTLSTRFEPLSSWF